MEPLRDHPAPSPSGSARNSGSFLFPGPKLNSIPLKRRLRHGKRAGPPGMRVYPNPMDHLPQTARKETRKLSGKTGKSQFSISFQDSLPQQSGIAMELLTWIRGNREAGAASTGDFFGGKQLDLVSRNSIPAGHILLPGWEPQGMRFHVSVP